MQLTDASLSSRRRWAKALRAGEWVDTAPGFFWESPELWMPLVDAVGGKALRRAAPPGGAVTVVIPALQVPLGWRAWLEDPAVAELLVLANGDFPAWTPEDPRVRVLRVPWEGHSRTRQRAVREVQTEYLLFSVDDALPRGEAAGWLRAGLGDFEAVFGRQLPWPDADPVTRSRLWEWTPPSSGTRPSPPHPAGGLRHDHVFALYRTQSLRQAPLPEVPIAEDWAWALQHRVGYCGDAAVVHAHPRRFRALFARTRATHRVFREAGMPPTVPGLLPLLRALPTQLGPDWRGGLGELLGQYVGGR